ncbi:GspE/PulE family protein [Zooshikella harenae]|uniref:Type II/IV secretion system protein n=1 Tax=Zooshikella harenae TaxID=2827238 RepID=A0ABS5ZHZ0_9GAMM|nr:GspE/PulE family protein [Zooshikella harenae]MBU2713594.1 type II/IV secretion system protein [Zooshikella harenae]
MFYSSELTAELQQELKVDDIVFKRLLHANDNDIEKLVLTLIKESYISRKKWGNKIGDVNHYAYLPLRETFIDEDLLPLIPHEIAEKYSAIVVYKLGSRVSIALKDPADQSTKDIISNFVGKAISPLFSFEDEIQKAIAMYYGSSQGLDNLMIHSEPSLKLLATNSKEQLRQLANKHELKQLTDRIIYMALKDRATDIHIEPKSHHLIIRFRKDGVLYEKAVLSSEIAIPLINCFKVLAGVDITERRKPLDGRFSFNLSADHVVDVRMSTLPSLHGETMVLRLLGAEFLDRFLNFEELGFTHDILEHLKEALNVPNGMIFVTGPTGSGKTTTLHCALNYICNSGINIVTIEDPIEYEHPEITQVAVNEKAGRTFSSVLRSVLRQDPDVVMIGEIRDLETARIAANAALTGHMVLTSLHTNDAIQAMTRMIEMGVEHFVLAPSVIGILGQRLVRKICTHCKEKYIPDEAYLKHFFDLRGVTQLPFLYRGVGCNACSQTGFSGRVAVHEFLGITNTLRNCILRTQDYEEFYRIAVNSKHYLPFAKDGLKKVLMGLTTFEEVSCSVNLFDDG